MASGDALAKGAVRAQFPPAGGRVSQQKWDEMFGDFDAEAYRRSGSSDTEASRDAGINAGEAVPDATGC